MAVVDKELKVAQVVNSGQVVADTYVVPNGKKVKVVAFHASSPDSSLAVTKLVWDYGGAGETEDWVIQRSEHMPDGRHPEFTSDRDWETLQP